MGKLVADMTPEELERTRRNKREAKRLSRKREKELGTYVASSKSSKDPHTYVYILHYDGTEEVITEDTPAAAQQVMENCVRYLRPVKAWLCDRHGRAL